MATAWGRAHHEIRRAVRHRGIGEAPLDSSRSADSHVVGHAPPGPCRGGAHLTVIAPPTAPHAAVAACFLASRTPCGAPDHAITLSSMPPTAVPRPSEPGLTSADTDGEARLHPAHPVRGRQPPRGNRTDRRGRRAARSSVLGHGGNIRRHVLDSLSPEQTSLLRAWSQETVDRLEPHRSEPYSDGDSYDGDS